MKEDSIYTCRLKVLINRETVFYKIPAASRFYVFNATRDVYKIFSRASFHLRVSRKITRISKDTPLQMRKISVENYKSIILITLLVSALNELSEPTKYSVYLQNQFRSGSDSRKINK